MVKLVQARIITAPKTFETASKIFEGELVTVGVKHCEREVTSCILDFKNVTGNLSVFGAVIYLLAPIDHVHFTYAGKV